jgi:hypothetical protein
MNSRGDKSRDAGTDTGIPVELAGLDGKSWSHMEGWNRGMR